MMHRHGDTQDIIDTILHADAKSGEFVGDVECLRGRTEADTMQNVWAFVKKNVKYIPDRSGHERVKSPGALFAEGKGDCKSFSIAVAAILRALGCAYKYRFVAYSSGDVTHVYVLAKGNRKSWYIIDSVHKNFDEEVPYLYKKDIAPAGIGRIGGISFDVSGILIIAGIITAILFRHR